MTKVYAWILITHFCPKFVYTKIFLIYIRIMKQYYSAIRKLWKPCFEIMAYSIVGMQPINM